MRRGNELCWSERSEQSVCPCDCTSPVNLKGVVLSVALMLMRWDDVQHEGTTKEKTT